MLGDQILNFSDDLKYCGPREKGHIYFFSFIQIFQIGMSQDKRTIPIPNFVDEFIHSEI